MTFEEEGALRKVVILLLPTKAARDDETSANRRVSAMRILDMIFQICFCWCLGKCPR